MAEEETGRQLGWELHLCQLFYKPHLRSAITIYSWTAGMIIHHQYHHRSVITNRGNSCDHCPSRVGLERNVQAGQAIHLHIIQSKWANALCVISDSFLWYAWSVNPVEETCPTRAHYTEMGTGNPDPEAWRDIELKKVSLDQKMAESGNTSAAVHGLPPYLWWMW